MTCILLSCVTHLAGTTLLDAGIGLLTVSPFSALCVSDGDREQANEYLIKSGDEGLCMYFVGSTPQQTIGSGVRYKHEHARAQTYATV